MRLFKRALSAFMALNMMLALLPLNIANANQADNTSGSYTVTLLTPENGSASFSDKSKTASTGTQSGYQLVTVSDTGELVPVENDGSVWAFSQGDTVEVILTPQSGYNVKSFVIRDANNNNILASKESTDNVFSFTMVGKNLTIESNFISSKSTEEPHVNPSENGGGNTPYEKPELTDKIAITTQMAINELPKVEDIAQIEIDAETIEEYTSLIDDANEMYFNELTNEQREQVDSSELFASTIALEELNNYLSDNELRTFSDEEIAYIQQMIDSLPELTQITNIVERDENGDLFVNQFGDGTEIYISSEEQDELVLKLLAIIEFMADADEGTHEKINNFYKVNELMSYFSGGIYASTLNPNNGIMTMADVGSSDANGINTSGRWWSSSINVNTYWANYFEGKIKTESGEESVLVHCGQSKLMPYAQRPTKVNFTGAQEVSDERIRKLFFYTLPEHSGAMCVLNQHASKHNYYMVHYALTSIYDPSSATSYMNNFKSEWEALLAQIDALPNVVDSGIPGCENFKAYKISYIGKQDMFYCLSTPVIEPDPFNLRLLKLGKKSAPQMSDAVLTGAIIKVAIFSEDEYARMGMTLPQTTQEAASGLFPAQTTLQFKTGLAPGSNDPKKMGYIDFGPDLESVGAERGPTNKYLVEGPVNEDYIHWFGTPGVYWIREVKESNGFLNSGNMSVIGTDITTNNIQDEGVLIQIELADNWQDIVRDGGNPWTKKVNGEVVDSSNIEIENELPEHDIELLENEYTPEVETWAEWEQTNTQWMNPQDDLKAIDHISVFNLMPNKEVTVRTYLCWKDLIDGIPGLDDEEIARKKETVDAVEKVALICKCGRDVCHGTYHEYTWQNVQEHGNKDFETEFEIDTSYTGIGDGKRGQTKEDLKGQDLIFMNYVYMPEMHENGDAPARASLYNDASEMLHFPKGDTVCLGDATGDHITHAWEEQDVKDTIHYENLRPNTEYRIEAWLMDKDTQDRARDAYGTPIENTQNTKYQVSDPSGTGDFIVDFHFDAHFYEQYRIGEYYRDEIEGRCGREYVVYVEIYQADEKVWERKDMNDMEESFYIPHFSTELLDENTKDHISYPGPGTVLEDTVFYDHLLPGRTYHIHGVLIDLDTNLPALTPDGKEITLDESFTPTSTEGQVTVKYNFDASYLSGHTVVSYIKVYLEGSTGSEQPEAWIGHHTDFWDTDQWMYFPYIDTYANDVKTGGLIRGETNANANHNAFAEDEMVIQDLGLV